MERRSFLKGLAGAIASTPFVGVLLKPPPEEVEERVAPPPVGEAEEEFTDEELGIEPDHDEPWPEPEPDKIVKLTPDSVEVNHEVQYSERLCANSYQRLPGVPVSARTEVEFTFHHAAELVSVVQPGDVVLVELSTPNLAWGREPDEVESRQQGVYIKEMTIESRYSQSVRIKGELVHNPTNPVALFTGGQMEHMRVATNPW